MERLRQRELRQCVDLVAASHGAADRDTLTDVMLDGLLRPVPGIRISYNMTPRAPSTITSRASWRSWAWRPGRRPPPGPPSR